MLAQGDRCPICATSALRHFQRREISKPRHVVPIIQCRSCEFAWQYPLNHSEQDSTAFFQAAYADPDVPGDSYFSQQRKTQIAQLEYEFMESLQTEPSTLLDIGAGAGIFARFAAEQGWRVTAADPALHIDFATASLSLTALKGTLDDLDKNQRFDVITAWDVIEHVKHPDRVIEQAHSHLNSGGWLVLETGNHQSFQRLRDEPDHWIYHRDHRWYFAPDSLQRLLAQAGFQEFRYCERVLRPGWHGQADYGGPSRAHLLSALARQPWRVRELLYRHRQFKKAKHWPLAGLNIFAIAARKSVDA